MKDIKSDMNTILDDVLIFEEFFRAFRDEHNHFKYKEAIKSVFEKGEKVLYISYEDILTFDKKLAAILIEKPETIIERAREAFCKSLEQRGNTLNNRYYFVRLSVESKQKI